MKPNDTVAFTCAMLRFHADMTGGKKAITDLARKVKTEDPELFAAHMAYRNLYQGPDAPTSADVVRVSRQYAEAFARMQERLAQKAAATNVRPIRTGTDG